MAKLPTTMPASNLTAVSTLELNTYTVTFKVNGTTVKTSDVTYTFPIEYPTDAEARAATPTGYSFKGWDSEITTMPAKDVTINAVLEAIEYKIVYYIYIQQEGSTSYSAPELVEEQTYAYGETINPPSLPTQAGRGTDGWENLPDTMPAETLTINAYYNLTKYTATFKADGETVATYIGQWSLPIDYPNDPTKDGYNFVGWDQDLTVMPASDVTINAVFEAKTYNINYYIRREYNQDGQLAYTMEEHVTTQTYKEGDTINPPALPTEEGYTATDWET